MPQTDTSAIQLPSLDISQRINPPSLSSLSKACKHWGFFHITNHGISEQLNNKLFSISNHLFTLPLQTKTRLGPSSHLKTYTPHFIASPFFESLRVSGPDYFASAKASAGYLFDPPFPEFCDVLQEYGSKMMELSTKISAILLECLGDGFEGKFYKGEFSKCHGYLRINNYSPLTIKKKEEEYQDEAVEGLGMHTDMSCITIVNQDEIGGLQVKSKEGCWMDIRPCDGTLVVNIGDLLQAWSNGRFRSSEHRVILKRPSNRISFAFFWCFEDEKVIRAPEEVVGEGNPRMYRPFVCVDYVKFRENSETGRFEKVGYTVNDFAALISDPEKEMPDG